MSVPASRKRVAPAVIVIAVILTAAALRDASWFFVPALLGATLACVLHPVVGWLRRLRLPAPAAATIAVLAAVAVLAALTIALEPPISKLVAEIPRSIATARQKLTAMGSPFDRIATLDGAPPTAAVPQIFGAASSLSGDFVEVVLLALFVLAAGDAWRRKLDKAVHDPARAAEVSDAVGEMRAVVGRYFVVTLLINVAQAVVIGGGLALFGYPSAILWGALTFLLEFIPYLGGLTMVVLLLIVGLASGQGIGHALLGPGFYLLVTTLQNNLVSPVAYGRGLRLNPTAILLALMLFWGLWGVAGAFLAVPLLAAIEVAARRIPSLSGLATFLAD